MTFQPVPEVAIAESYPTFWDVTPPALQHPSLPLDDPYSRFINLTEDEFPSDEFPMDATPAGE